MTADRVALLRERLTAALAPEHLEVVDESAAHAGHAGARAGGGHFALTIVSPAFNGRGLLERHRMVYAAVGDLMQGEVHALSIKAYASGEI